MKNYWGLNDFNGEKNNFMHDNIDLDKTAYSYLCC